MVGIAFDRMAMGHLDHNQQREQRQAQQCDRAKSTWLRAAIPAALCLESSQQAILIFKDT